MGGGEVDLGDSGFQLLFLWDGEKGKQGKREVASGVGREGGERKVGAPNMRFGPIRPTRGRHADVVTLPCVFPISP